MEEEELQADFKKHLNVDFGEEYEEETLRTSLPRKSLEANEYVANNLTEQLNDYQQEENNNYYSDHEEQAIGRNYSDVSDGPVGFYQDEKDERRKSSGVYDNGQIFNYGHPEAQQNLQNIAEEAQYNNNQFADVEEEYNEKSSENSNIDLRDLAESKAFENNQDEELDDNVLSNLRGKNQNVSPATENTQEET